MSRIIALFDLARRTSLPNILQAIWNAVADWWFDVRYGLRTRQAIELDDLEIESENKQRGVRYRATRVRPFRKLMKVLTLTDETNGTFLDLGCGKGRVLLLASELGFRRVVGVDFSHQLCEEARSNLRTYRRNTRLDVDVRIIHSDVCEYEIADDDNVFFLFRPFDVVVMSNVLKNLDSSLKTNSRKVWLIYNYLLRTLVALLKRKACL